VRLREAFIQKHPSMGELLVYTDYVSDFVEDLKWELPSYARRWDPGMRCWRVMDSYLTRVQEILERYYDSIILDDEVVRGEISNGTPPYSELFLSPNAPLLVVKAAYRACAMMFHPDHEGGDTERMKKINLAYEELCRRLGG
jgi:hypothetical protein